MSSGSDHGSGSPLPPEDARRLAELRDAESLEDLAALTGASDEHDAYFRAKREWARLVERERSRVSRPSGLPGDRIVVDGTAIHVHGITHADTDAEREYLLDHVATFLSEGSAVYCEQGIRSMYFEGFPGVGEMDDYHWAMQEWASLGDDTRIGDLSLSEFHGFREEVDSLRSQFREAAFSLIDSGGDLYGERFKNALGDVASDFFMSHEEMAMGNDFESFRKSRMAAKDPGRLAALQDYYRKAFLPQPVEREWLRRHDPELEIVTHARNERMADYAVYHEEEAPATHLIVGAAHQPGVTYYLRRHRDDRRTLDGFELTG